MVRTMARVLAVAVLLLGCFAARGQAPYTAAPQVQYVGIPRSAMNYAVASQRGSNWCWAASIQMVLNYYGVAITQEQIVARTYGTDPYGNLPDWTGSFEAITANLNNWTYDNAGRPYRVQATLHWGAPTPTLLVWELAQRRPVIAAYVSGPNAGHAVVLTGASYYDSPQGPMVTSIIARDPWPSDQNIAALGRVEYQGWSFAGLMTAHWYVRVTGL